MSLQALFTNPVQPVAIKNFISCSQFQDFSMQMLHQLLDEDYTIIQLFVKPGHIGHTGMARHRTYIFCAHRERCRYLVDVKEAYRTICKTLRKNVSTRPGDYFVATQQQVQVDALKVAHDRGIEFQPETCMIVMTVPFL